MRKNMVNITEETMKADMKGFTQTMVAAKRATAAITVLYDFLDCGSVPQSQNVVDIIFDNQLQAKRKGYDITEEEALRLYAENAVRKLRHQLCLWNLHVKNVGLEVCGYLGDTTEDLCQIYTSLYAYHDFIPDVNILLENFA